LNETGKRRILKFLESNENENITYQDLWDRAKEVLRGMSIAMSGYTEIIT
jgi:hypothetical protein